MTLEEIVNLQQQSISISFDTCPVKVPFSSLKLPLIEQFFIQVNSHGRFSLRDDLLTNMTKLRLIREGSPTLAANLLFGEHDFSIHLGRFKSETTIIDDMIVKSPIFSAVDDVMVFIKKHINLEYSFDGKRERSEHWQYPLEAIRELALNAIVHRDYRSTSDIVVKVFDDRIVFSNPGRIFGNLSIEDIQRNDYVSSLRNKLLAEAFYLSGDIEKYGTGFIRIRETLSKYPEVTLHVEEMGDFFIASLRVSPPISPPISGIDVITSLEERVLRCIVLSPTVSSGDMASQLGMSRDTIKEYLGRLKEKGFLVREGSTKSGRWRVPEAGRVALEEKMK
jgi:ATP-dependent DNA helicase RecG